MHLLANLHVNKTNFHIKGFTPGLTYKQRQKSTWNGLLTVFEGIFYLEWQQFF